MALPHIWSLKKENKIKAQRNKSGQGTVTNKEKRAM